MNITAEQRMQDDIENICEMAKDDVDAALWHYGRNKSMARDEINKAIANLQLVLQFIED